VAHPRTTSRSLQARFLADGPLERLPKRPDDREALLRFVAAQVLPAGECDDEPGLNLRLRRFTEDVAMLRRALVDHGLVDRAADGSSYAGLVARGEVTVRPVTAEDDAEVDRLTVAAYLAAGHFPDARSGYMAKVARSAAARRVEAETWIAERDGVAVGAVTLAVAGGAWADVAAEGELEFRLLVVDPAVQRSGAGRVMIEAIVDAAREREGIERVVLTTNADWDAANAVYPRLGFHRAPERDWRPADNPQIELIVYSITV